MADHKIKEQRGGKVRRRVEYLTPEEVIRYRIRCLDDGRDIRTFFVRLLVLLVFTYIFFFRIFGIGMVPNDDMMPRLSGGDLMLFFRLQKEVDTDDLLVYQAGEERGNTPQTPGGEGIRKLWTILSCESSVNRYIGRVVAKPGDSVDISEEGVISINGSVIIEPDIFYVTKQYDGGIRFPLTLEADQYFLLADYREGAKDSRIFGPVSLGQVEGRIIAVIRRSSL